MIRRRADFILILAFVASVIALSVGAVAVAAILRARGIG